MVAGRQAHGHPAVVRTGNLAEGFQADRFRRRAAVHVGDVRQRHEERAVDLLRLVVEVRLDAQQYGRALAAACGFGIVVVRPGDARVWQSDARQPGGGSQ